MTESQQATIERLMEEGLNQYAMGDDARAIECWRRVLELDPEHAEAQDYLRTASGEECAAPQPAPEPAPASSETPTLLDEAIASFRRGEPAEGLDLLEALTRTHAHDLHTQAYFELARCALIERYRDRLAGGVAVPQLKMSPEEILRFNLPPNAGFVLSNVDGSTSVNEMTFMTGKDPFETLRSCCKLLDAGIIEVSP